MKELILGGARSGKSALAQQQATASGLEVVFIATASADDAEMADRIARHQADRPGHWQLVEEPVALADTLRRHASAKRCLLVDCLTLWLSNLLHDETVDEARLARERDALLQILPSLPGHLILVSNEVGLGVIPLGQLTRRFCDEAGRLHQALAAQCDRVTLTVAGLPHRLKDTTTGDRP
jgi:adenosylcobinamide kinase/adenosylcobinamide-phosphate guanylyltransferase